MPETLGNYIYAKWQLRQNNPPDWWELEALGPPPLHKKKLYLPTSVRLAVDCHSITGGSGYLQLPEIVSPDMNVTLEFWGGERLGPPGIRQLSEGSSARQWAQQAEAVGTCRTWAPVSCHEGYCLLRPVVLRLEGKSEHLSNSAARWLSPWSRCRS